MFAQNFDRFFACIKELYFRKLLAPFFRANVWREIILHSFGCISLLTWNNIKVAFWLELQA